MIQHMGRTLLRGRRVVILVTCFVLIAWADGPPGANHKKQQAPPIKLGTSGSNVKDINSSFCCVGTLGALLKKGTATYILSNNHVLARSNTAALGEAIMPYVLMKPGRLDEHPMPLIVTTL